MMFVDDQTMQFVFCQPALNVCTGLMLPLDVFLAFAGHALVKKKNLSAFGEICTSGTRSLHWRESGMSFTLLHWRLSYFQFHSVCSCAGLSDAV